MQPQQQDINRANATEVNKSHPKAHKPFKILLLFLTCIGIAAGTLWLLLHFYPVTPLKESDFRTATTTSTSFTLPRQWGQLQTGAPGVTYGNEIGGNRSSGMINVIYSGAVFYYGNFSTASDSFKSSQREKYFLEVDEWIEGTTSCGDRKVLKKEIDTLSTNEISGLFYFELSCTSPNGKPYTLMNRVMIGDDGYMRIATITAQDYDLKVNRSIYEKMLRSVAQTNS